MFPRFQVSIPLTVLVALSLDDTVMQQELDVRVIHQGTRAAVVSLTLASACTLLDDIDSRCEWDGVVWDQPVSWKRACRRALPKVAEQVARQVPQESRAWKLAESVRTSGRVY